MKMERGKICHVCQDFKENVGHQAEWCPNMTCQKCGQPGHGKIHCMYVHFWFSYPRWEFDGMHGEGEGGE